MDKTKIKKITQTSIEYSETLTGISIIWKKQLDPYVNVKFTKGPRKGQIKGRKLDPERINKFIEKIDNKFKLTFELEIIDGVCNTAYIKVDCNATRYNDNGTAIYFDPTNFTVQKYKAKTHVADEAIWTEYNEAVAKLSENKKFQNYAKDIFSKLIKF